MTRWGMVMDLRQCIGCEACTVACTHTNELPANLFWRQVVDCGIGEYPARERWFLTMGCMHCSEPPCLDVCPTTATYRRPDGIVDINYELCIGCGYCTVACPYLARTITFRGEADFEKEIRAQQRSTTNANPNHTGICTKCNFCLPRIDAGLAQGLKPGLDSEATPACVVSCTANALHFGDLDDSDSVVSRLIRENNTAHLQAELGLDPAVSYIVPSYPSGDTGNNKTRKMELIQPKQQRVWGWPAIVNFILGGMATGLYLLSLLVASLPGDTFGRPQSVGFKLLAPALVGLGFLALTLEAGRPWRSRYLLCHLRRSWMSRETLAGAVFIPTAVLDWFLPHPLLWGLAAIAAMSLMISQGFLIYRARAVMAWNVPLMPILFVTSGFATGSGLLLLAASHLLTLGRGPVMIGLICVVMNLAVWLLYLRRSHDTAFQEATKALRRPNSLILTVGIGHLLPILVLGFLLAFPGLGSGLQQILAWLAGLGLIIGGTGQKAGLILQAGYLRAIVLGPATRNTRGANEASWPITNQKILAQPDHAVPYQKTVQVSGDGVE